MEVTVSRHAHFNAAHRLHNEKWDEATNNSVFGKCANPHYHGHNYELIVSVTGPVDPETGYVIDIKTLSDIIEEEIEERFDHKNLNEETVEFRHLIPTAENMAVVIWKILRERIDSEMRIKVMLYETPRNFVEFSGD